jgi:hypothetical protein
MQKRGFIVLIIGIGLLFQGLNAQTWSATKRLTWNPSDSERASIATDSSNNIYLVWRDYAPGNSEIYFKKSTNGGTSWAKKRLTWNSGTSSYPSITIDTSNRIHVVWQDNSSGSSEIHYKKSTNGGTSWTGKKLTHGSTGCGSMIPAIAIDTNDYIRVVWYSDTSGNMEIYFSKSKNGGSTWNTKQITWNAGQSRTPVIATNSNNNIYVAWYDDSPGNYEIYMKKSTNGGNTWTTQRLTWNSGSSSSPSVATDPNNFIHIVWQDYSSGNWEIYHTKSTNGGTSWAAKRLTWNPDESEWPEVATDSNNNIHVVWDDETPGNNEVFYKRSTNGGMNWTMKRLTWTSGSSEFPTIICDSMNKIYATWHDNTPGNKEIYYKKGQQ